MTPEIIEIEDYDYCAEHKALDVIEARIAALEKKVYGDGPVDEEFNVVNSLNNTNTLLLSAISGREKIALLMQRIPEIEEYLDPAFEENSDVFAKFELLKLEKPQLEKNIEMLTKVQELKYVLDSEPIRNIPNCASDLEKLMPKYEELSTATEQQCKELVSFVQKYNELMTFFNITLTKLQEAVTTLEAKSIPKSKMDV